MLKHLDQVSLSTINILEKDIEERIIENPNILGLKIGSLLKIDSQRRQKNGILDLILEDENEVRYVVEIMRGELDESHIIRLIEYWDTERKMRPDFQYKAILIAESMTRYLNILSLLQKAVPLIAIQMVATKISDNEYGLFFAKVLDYIEERKEPEEAEKADRNYWLKNSNKENMDVVDKIFNLIQKISEEQGSNEKIELNYAKPYIGLKVNGKSSNFIQFKAQKNKVHLWCSKIFNSDYKLESIQNLLSEAEILIEVRGGIDIKAKALENQKDVEILKKIIREAYKNWSII